MTTMDKRVRRTTVKQNRCDTCSKEFPTCDAEKIVWGIDRDPSARGADADKVLECDAYAPNAQVERPLKASKGER